MFTTAGKFVCLDMGTKLSVNIEKHDFIFFHCGHAENFSLIGEKTCD